MLSIGKQLTPDQRISKAVNRIMDKITALSSVLMIGERNVVDNLPTACTNGRDEKYGRDFVESIDDGELRFTVLHEQYHKLYKHLITWRQLYDEDGDIANQACDYVINLKIVDEFGETRMENGDLFIKPFDWILIDGRFRGMSARQVFDILKKEKSDEPQGGNGGGGDGQGNNQGEGDGKDSGDTQPQRGGKPNRPMDTHDWDGAKAIPEDEAKTLEREIDEAIRQGALVAGKLGSGGMRDLGNILQPKIDWRQVLRDFITATCAGKDFSTWRRPNRRFIASDIYMPSSISEHVEELVLAIDTSGSIGCRELANFLGEVKCVAEVVKPNRVRVLYWDTKIVADELYEGDAVTDLIRSTKPAGGGGTDINCVCDYLASNKVKPQAVIVLTDGYLGSSWGKWSVPILWCILNHKSAKPTVGQAVHIEDN
jgi:predicted metal-dependent peptidase